MYQFSGKLKIFAFALMILGVLGTAISFMSAPKSLEEAKEIIAKQEAAHHGGHGENHAEEGHDGGNTSHNTEEHLETKKSSHEAGEANHEDGSHKDDSHSDALKENHSDTSNVASTHKKDSEDHSTNAHVEDHNSAKADKSSTHGSDHAVSSAHSDNHHDDHHAEHLYHQMKNRPVSAFYVSLLFFLGITLLVLAFYAGQRIAHAGWSVVLFRVMEAITANLHYVSIVMLVFIILTAMHSFHLFPWMAEGVFDPTSPNYDPIVDGKKWWMNLPGWTIRSVFYLVIWNGYRFLIRRNSIKQDNGDLKLHKRNYNMSVAFVLLFMITESMASWDWIMGIDPHWFSTLFGWYVLATFLVSALTVICLVTIYLRSKGHLPLVNDSHIHDLAKFMFGFSVFWTYLWFAQFMLIWYADMPEETTYFVQRFNEYKVPFLGMVVLNFIFPVLILINSDFKSIPWVIAIAGVFILVGHYVDLFVMIMPGTVGGQWGFGIGEISGFLFFLGLFIFATFNAFAKAPPVPKGNPFLHESETHHYYVIEHRGEDNNAHH